MEYRLIEKNEYLEANRLMAQCFHFDHYKDPEQVDEHAHEDCYGGFDENGTMTSFLIARPEEVNYFGHRAVMGKVGGVTCLPQFRRGGHVRHLLTEMLRTCRERGDHLSALYPFNHDFYRKFGYELCSVLQTVYIPMNELKKFPQNGKVTAYQEGMDISPFEKVWKTFCRKYQLSSLRENNWQKKWLERLPGKPWESRKYAYLWQNEQGESKAFIVFSFDKREEGIVYRVNEYAYEDKEALYALFGFMKVMCAQGVAVEMDLPLDVPVMHIFSDPYVIKSSLKVNGMARVLDIPFCMENRSFEKKEGVFTFRVTGDVLEENNGCWEMDLGKNKCRKISDRETDMTLSIQALSALCLGSVSPAFREDIVCEKKELLSIFTPQHVRYTEGF